MNAFTTKGTLMPMPNTLLDVKYLNEDIAVSAQLTAEDMHKVATMGFKSLIINLPDYEISPEQQTAETITSAAKLSGLTVIYQPVSPPTINQQDCDTFKSHLQNLPKPILAFCRSGNRCTVLFNGAK